VGEYLLTRAPNAPKLTTKRVLQSLTNPNIIAVLIGLFIAAVPNIGDVFFPKMQGDPPKLTSPPLSFVTTALKTYGNSALGIVTLVVAATLGKRIEKMTAPRWAVRAGNMYRSLHDSIAYRRRSFQMLHTQEAVAEAELGGFSIFPRKMKWRLRRHQVQDDGDTAFGESGGLAAIHEDSHEAEDAFPPQDDAHGHDSDHSTHEHLPPGTQPQQEEEEEAEPLTPSSARLRLSKSRHGSEGDDDANMLLLVPEKDADKSMAQSAAPLSVSVNTVATTNTNNDSVSLANSTDAQSQAEQAQPLSRYLIMWMVIGRVVFVCALQFALVYLLADRIFRGPNAPLIKLVLYAQSCSPTAAMAVVACQQSGLRNAAETVAVAMVFQYLLVGVIQIFSSAIAISLVYK
jgi:predicted permease